MYEAKQLQRNRARISLHATISPRWFECFSMLGMNFSLLNQTKNLSFSHP